MSAIAKVIYHSSQFPENVRRDLLGSLRTRRVNPKFHYDSVKQTNKWLALHQAYSPSRTDLDCQKTYENGFAATIEQIADSRVCVIGLGCGGGQKDTKLLQLLAAGGKETLYVPCDVSAAMVLVARQTALTDDLSRSRRGDEADKASTSEEEIRLLTSAATGGRGSFNAVPIVLTEEKCSPIVCDLATASDLPAVLDQICPPEASRLITFFGMIPNFEPDEILPKLASLARPEDQLLFSANLAPGPDYAAGVQRVLPQYDNPLTRDWLMTFLLDLGCGREDGELHFQVEDGTGDHGLKRIVADFRFTRTRRIELEGEIFEFSAGDVVRLFFSYRYTSLLVHAALQRHGLRVAGEWITQSEQEGVFLVERA